MTYTQSAISNGYSGPNQVNSSYSIVKTIAGCCNRGCRPCVKDFR